MAASVVTDNVLSRQLGIDIEADDGHSHNDARKIKVCHLAAGDLWAGAEVQLSLLVSSLHRMPEFDISVILLNDGDVASKLRNLGIRTTVIPESRHSSVSIVRQLVGHFAQHHVDILHTHNFKDNVLGILSTLAKKECRRVRTVHGRGEPFTGLAAAKMCLYRGVDHLFTRRWVDRIVAVSVDLESDLARSYGAQRIICIHNGIDLDKVQATKPSSELKHELNLGEQDFVIGTMGRLVAVKGLDTFLKAARIIRRQKDKVKFLVVGDGPLKETLRSLARQYELEDNVLFLGHRNDGYDILAMIDVLALPSRSEGIPMVLLEALALARPVVASRVGGIPEVIEDRVNGLLVGSGNETELAQACTALIDDYDLAERYGQVGRQRVWEQFSAGSMAQKVAEVYRSLLQTAQR
jgi:glycosyltransferase involved in cell wall biosynthesis